MRKQARRPKARPAVMNFTFTKGSVDKDLYHQYAAAAMQALLFRGMNWYGGPDDPKPTPWLEVVATMAHRVAAAMLAAEPDFQTMASTWALAAPPRKKRSKR